MARIFQKSRCRWKFLICKHPRCRWKFLISKHPRCKRKFLWSFFINLAKILGKKEVSPINDYWGDFLNNSIFPQFFSVYVLANGEKFAKLDNFPIVFGVSSCFDWGKFLISAFFIQIVVHFPFVIGEFPGFLFKIPSNIVSLIQSFTAWVTASVSGIGSWFLRQIAYSHTRNNCNRNRL